MTILITDEDGYWQIVYSANGNTCIHQFDDWGDTLKDLDNATQIEHNLFKCSNPAPDRLLEN